MRLIYAEITKLVRSRTTLVLTLIGVLLIGVGVVFVITDDTFTGVFTGTDPQVAALFDQVGGAYIIVLIVGILSLTTEFRHGTIGRTLMLTPSRTVVLLAKLAASTLYALFFTVVGVATVLLGLAVLGDLSTATFGEQTFRAVLVAPVGLALASLLGVAIGAVVRSQVLAIAGTLIYAFLVETLIGQFFPAFARWLPFQALGGVFSSPETRASIPEGFPMPLEPAIAIVVFLFYAAVLATAAVTLMRFRDV
jgi:hypothetical protein